MSGLVPLGAWVARHGQGDWSYLLATDTASWWAA